MRCGLILAFVYESKAEIVVESQCCLTVRAKPFHAVFFGYLGTACNLRQCRGKFVHVGQSEHDAAFVAFLVGYEYVCISFHVNAELFGIAQQGFGHFFFRAGQLTYLRCNELVRLCIGLCHDAAHVYFHDYCGVFGDVIGVILTLLGA